MLHKKHIVQAIVCFTMILILSGCLVTPKPITPAERSLNIAADFKEMYKDQETVNGPVSVEIAMARAVKYNLEHRLKLMEESLAIGQLESAHYDLLPRLTARAGYTHRDSISASSSTSILTNTQSLEPSTSLDNDRRDMDLSLTWNILDFGVSYYQAHQEANRQLAASEKRRKTIHILMKQVREAYWRVAGAQDLSTELEKLLTKVETALARSEKVKNERLRSPLEMLRYQGNLLEIAKKLRSIRDELSTAKPQLASLMNLPPGQSFEVVLPESLPVPTVNQSIDEMEEYALLNRPDLKETEYELRISTDETKKAIARILPGIELNLGSKYDSNSYLVNNNWIEGGGTITWNLLNIFSAPAKIKAAKAREEVSRSRRLVLSMAALAQVHISKRQYDTSLNQFKWSQKYRQIKNEIYQQVQKEKNSKVNTSLEAIRTAANLLTARLLEYKSFVQLQGAYGQIQSTLGVDPIPRTVASHAINDMAEVIREQMTSLEK